MNYRAIDLSGDPRQDHIAHFLTMEDPFVSATVQVDITDWLARVRARRKPVFLSFQYAVVRAANRIPELRRRIMGDGVVEYEFCNPSYIVARPDGTYRYCNVNANQPYDAYIAESEILQLQAINADRLAEEGDVLSMLFISCVPWFTYTGLQMPHSGNRFSNPSITWGKFETEARLCLVDGAVAEREITRMPVTLMVNHALVDGIHIGRFFAALNEELDQMRWA